jgi:hypothetical protein
MRLGRHVQAVQHQQHQGDDDGDAARPKTRRWRAGKPQQRGGAGQPDQAADQHLGQRMRAEHQPRHADQRRDGDGQRQRGPSVPQQQAGQASGDDRRRRRVAARSVQQGQAEAVRAGTEDQFQHQHDAERRHDCQHPHQCATPPALRQQSERHGGGQRQDHRLVGEIGQKLHAAVPLWWRVLFVFR